MTSPKIFDRLSRIVILAETSSPARSGIPVHWLGDTLDAKGQSAVHPQRFFPTLSSRKFSRSYVCVRFNVLQTVHGMRRKGQESIATPCGMEADVLIFALPYDTKSSLLIPTLCRYNPKEYALFNTHKLTTARLTRSSCPTSQRSLK